MGVLRGEESETTESRRRGKNDEFCRQDKRDGRQVGSGGSRSEF